ncbi:hypothetical protein [Chryseobacterium oryzae]|uniref:Uncharacterized protein n=1 Tax=Chryseobacterium oryzae TaxID=2929799 RepID=A0ABY4BE51_9FLAO|nr:hypothetical protein [Chryseobacterium oryzae]UOE37019.1 hypothetical protein MTP08_08035 [Chryseobacterium oryzae]
MKTTIKLISIFSYMFIILAGWMSGIPFILWLLFSLFDFGNIDQLFAFLGISGIVLNFTKWKSNILINILAFIFMLSPIVSRLIQVPIEAFNYLAFKIPLGIFIITYITYMILNTKQKNCR